jgi:ATP-dependent exoDNAse (exonuclease V) beta subunit
MNTFRSCFITTNTLHVHAFASNGQLPLLLLEEWRKNSRFNSLLESGELTGTVTKQLLQPWIQDTQLIEKAVDHVLRVDFFLLSPDNLAPLPFTGVQLIQRKLLMRYLHRLLTMDAEQAPFTIIGLEKNIAIHRNLDTPSGKITCTCGGTIDRLQQKDHTVYLIDYKTGGTPSVPSSVEALFFPHNKRNKHVFQTFLYSSILHQQYPTVR